MLHLKDMLEKIIENYDVFVSTSIFLIIMIM